MKDNTVFCKLPESNLPDSLILRITQKKSGIFLINIINPSNNRSVFKKTIKAKDLSEALAVGRELKAQLSSKIKTKYIKRIFISRPKKGKMKSL